MSRTGTTQREAQEPTLTPPKKSSGVNTTRGETAREVTTLKRRDEWVRLAAAENLSPILRVVAMRLAHFYNGKTGQLNPSYATLAAECDTTERTAKKAVAAFRKLGMIADRRSSGGRQDATNDFTLILPYRRVFTRTPVSTQSAAPTGVRAGTRRVSSSVFDGCPAVHPNSEEGNSEGIAKAALPPRTADDERLSIAGTAADDAPLSPAFTASVDAATPPPTQALNQRTPDGALIKTAAQPETPCQAASLEICAPTDANAADAAVLTPGLERVFQSLRVTFPNPAGEAEARSAYCATLRDADDVLWTVRSLLAGERRYRKAISQGFLKQRVPQTLAEFIQRGYWRSQPPVNRAMSEARAA